MPKNVVLIFSPVLCSFRALSPHQHHHMSERLPGHFPEPEQPAAALAYLGSVLGALGRLNSTLIKPMSLLVYISMIVFRQLLKLVDFIAPTLHVSGGPSSTIISNALNDPITRAEQFVRDLEEELLPAQQFSTHHSDRVQARLPPFFQGSYTQALFMATLRAKFLFVYLNTPKTEESASLFGLVTSQPFLDLFNDEHTLIWGGDLSHPEAYQLANSLNITKFPVLGLLCLTRATTMTPEGPRKGAARLSLVLKIQGSVHGDPAALVQAKFVRRIMKYEADLAIIRGELREAYLADATRRRQDLEYNRLLEADRRKKEENRYRRKHERYLKFRQPYFHELDSGLVLLDGTLRVAFKFRLGERITVHFPRGSPVLEIYVYVELRLRGMLQDRYELSMSEEEAQREFGGFEPRFGFQLKSGVPPRSDLASFLKSLEIQSVLFLHPSGLLIVESGEAEAS